MLIHPMPKHSPRVAILLLGVAMFAWPGIMLVHEFGHILAAWCTGGTVTRLIWHPLVFSRTDVSPNASPLVVVWAGPIVGCLLPILLERLVAFTLPTTLYIARLFAGFCLIANGAYLGIGAFSRVGDAGEMLRLGTPIWVLIVFGVLATGLGLWFWHRASFRLGFGSAPAAAIPWIHVAYAVAAGVLLNGIALLFGDRGL